MRASEVRIRLGAAGQMSMASKPSAAIRSQAFSTGKLLNWTEEVESRIFQLSPPANAEAASRVGPPRLHPSLPPMFAETCDDLWNVFLQHVMLLSKYGGSALSLDPPYQTPHVAGVPPAAKRH